MEHIILCSFENPPSEVAIPLNVTHSAMNLHPGHPCDSERRFLRAVDLD